MGEIRNRLNRLESNAAALPPNGAALIRQGERLPAEARGAWLDQRTDAELEAIRIADGGTSADWDRLTIAELQQIAAGDCSPLGRVKL